jgi:two-component system response regulator AtoC
LATPRDLGENVPMKILIVEDDPLMQATFKIVFKDLEITQSTSMEDALLALQKEVYAAAFLDINLKTGTSGDGIQLLKKIREGDQYLPCVMISGVDDRETIIKCLDLGAVDYVVKGGGSPELYRLALHKAMTWRKLFAESQASRTSTNVNPRNFDEMLGNSPAVRDLKDLMSKMGKLQGPFLILGETGSGKELVARALWKAKGDNRRPFIAVNCASLPENLVESELFGYERGAFTGALTTKTGLFEAANGGDIFLDEIGELNTDLQAKLLRVLQEKRVRRLGSEKERPIDFRVIAATNVDLINAVHDKDFREDLFFRINVHQIKVPALRDRPSDISLLAQAFMNDLGLSHVTVESAAKDLLEKFLWPGNIRQLKSFCQAIIPHLNTSKPSVTEEIVNSWIKMNDLKRAKRENGDFSPEEEVKSAFETKKTIDLVTKLDSLQRNYVDAALSLTNDNRSQAAKLLGVSRQRLSNWLSEWGTP